jgi:hypothetical protein
MGYEGADCIFTEFSQAKVGRTTAISVNRRIDHSSSLTAVGLVPNFHFY